MGHGDRPCRRSAPRRPPGLRSSRCRGGWWARRARGSSGRPASGTGTRAACARRRRAIRPAAGTARSRTGTPSAAARRLSSAIERPERSASMHRRVVAQRARGLGEVADRDPVARPARAGGGRELLGQDPQQRRLAAAVGADDADALAAASRRARRRAGPDRRRSSRRRPPSASTRWPPREPLRSASAILRRSKTGRSTFSMRSICICLTRAWRAARSLTRMCAQWRKRRTASSRRAISFCWRDVLLLLALELELARDDVGAVGARPHADRALVELGDLGDGRVEQVAVVGDHHDGAVEVVQQRAEPLAARHVEVGLGLVEQQHVRAPGEAGGERDELALAAGELARRHLERVAVDPERAQVAERLALGAVAAGVGPAREQPLVVGQRAGHRLQVGGERADRRAAPRRACSSASSASSSGRAARTVARASRSSPSTICGR